MNPKAEAWVTCATNDNEIIQSLVLARSLRRVYTTRKIVIVVTTNIPREKRSLLDNEFDAIFLIDNNSSFSSSISLELLASLYGWKLTVFNKCVFISGNNLILKNCDDLFKMDEISAFSSKTLGFFDSSLFIFKPSLTTFIKILKFSEKNCLVSKGTEEVLLNKYWSSRWNNISLSKYWSGKFISLLPPTSLSCLNELSVGIKLATIAGEGKNNLFNEIIQSMDVTKNNFKIGSENLAAVWMDIFKNEIYSNLPSKMGISGIVDQNLNLMHPSLESDEISKDENIMNTMKLFRNTGNYDMLNDSIAIIGMSCRFPGANSPEELWEVLINEKDEISSPPESRWNPEDFDFDFSELKGGFLKCPVEEFDGKFFEISPREAVEIDPQQRMLLEITWEALEDAGINPASLRGSSDTGVYLGTWTQNYKKLLEENKVCGEGHRLYLGNSFAAASARVGYKLGLNGPNIGIESGCSSSMISVHLACESLRRGETKLALAGGINLILKPFVQQGETEYILSKDGHCKTFDEKADGFGRAEGCGILILKKYADAIKDGDNVLAVIRGSALSQEGTTSSFGTPSKVSQALAVKNAITNAGIKSTDVSYVEAHGTGTPVGDPIEIEAICSEYCNENRKERLYIGSVKTNIGHSESAAGVAGIIKVILSFQHGIIPAHKNLDVLNPLIDLKSIVEIPVKAVKWEKPNSGSKLRMAGVSSFGISGANVHMIIQEPLNLKSLCAEMSRNTTDRPMHILTLSAKSDKALADLAQAYRNYFLKNPENSIADICYTSNNSRAHFNHRIAIVGNSIADLDVQLLGHRYSAAGDENVEKNNNDNPRIAFLFTGQGSQYTGMANELYSTHPIFKRAINQCNNILQENFDLSVMDIFLKNSKNDCKLLDHTIYSQISIFCVEYALFHLWESFGVKPDCVLGHSLGEFVAATAAGIISLEDALKLVYERSRLIESLPKGGMIAVLGNHEKTVNLVKSYNNNTSDSWIDVAVINSGDEVVLSGRPQVLEEFAFICEGHHLKIRRIHASQAFHSRDIELITDEYRKVTNGIKYNSAKCMYISGTTGNKLNENISSEYWLTHAKSTVNFRNAVTTLGKENCTIYIEIGPNPVLLALAMSNLPVEETSTSIWLPSLRKNENNWSTILNSLSKLYIHGVHVDWFSFNAPYESLRTKVALPKYQFQRQKYWFETSSEKGTKPLHPLIGKKIPLVTSENIYHQSLNLKNVSYVEHHKVANKIIMPGAGFLEMILTAGYSTMHGLDDFLTQPITPLVVENFCIEAPMELKDGLWLDIQTIVKAPDSTDKEGESGLKFKVSVFTESTSQVNTSDEKWKRHSTGMFAPYYSHIDDTKVNIDDIRTRCTNETFEIYKMYDEFLKIGLNFGSYFRSIQKVWRNDSETLAEIRFPQGVGKFQDYLCHPILIDALIQCCALGSEQKQSLQLPIGVKKFIWVSRRESSHYFAHMNKSSSIKLYDAEGHLLAILDGVEVVETTIESFLIALEVESNKLPDLLTNNWIPIEGQKCNDIDLTLIVHPTDIQASLSKCLQDMMIIDQEAEMHMGQIDKYCGMLIFKMLTKIGWNPFIGEKLNVVDFMSNYIIPTRYENILKRFFNHLTDDGLFNCEMSEEDGVQQWTIVEIPNNSRISQIESNIKKESIFPRFVDFYEVVIKCLEHLPLVLQGKDTMLSVIFNSHQDKMPPAEMFYTKSVVLISANEILAKVVESISKSVQEQNTRGPVRVLEIGAGTGATSSYVLSTLETEDVSFMYEYTDISQVLLTKAEDKFRKFENCMKCSILNIENDPKLQGFVPYSYDLIIASNVIHATEYLDTSIKNIRHLLAPGGYVVLIELIKDCRLTDIVFGTLDGFERFNDHHLRKDTPLVSDKVWEQLLQQNGFPSTATLKSNDRTGVIVGKASLENVKYTVSSCKLNATSIRNIWIIFTSEDEFSKQVFQYLEKMDKIIVFVKVSNEFRIVNEHEFFVDPTQKSNFEMFFNYFLNFKDNHNRLEGISYNWGLDSKDNVQKMLQGLLYLSHDILTIKAKVLPKLYVFTKGMNLVKDEEVCNPAAGSFYGFVNSLKSEHNNLQTMLIDLDPESSFTEELLLGRILWNSFKGYCISIRDNELYAPMGRIIEASQTPLKLPLCERFKIILPETNSIDDLSIGPSHQANLEGTQMEISVKATGLNFRDILIVMKPDGYYSSFESEIGTDYSGIILSVGPNVKSFKPGDEIFGSNFRGSLSSHAIVQSEFSCIKPKQMTFSEAATLPSVYFTAHHCLLNIIKLTSKDTILIHVASGGVGLIAIQIAQRIGARIIATAGSKRKRAYIRLQGVENVFHSRNTTFADDIERLDNIKGVDVVLNSLTSPGFKEASLRICNRDARFVEIGKINIWQPEEVKELRHDIKYTIVNLENVSLEVMSPMVQKLEEDVSNGNIKPLPYSRFEMTRIREALHYFRKARHIGKIVVVMPELQFVHGKLEISEKLFNSQSTYLITGGLGGIGMEVAKWMAESGAVNIILASRRTPDSKAETFLKELKNKGVNIVTRQVDVGDFSQCKNLFEEIEVSFPPLRGVMHSAGTLSDGILLNQTWSKFETVFQAKVKGSWNLHKLTMTHSLEHFVLYSSVAGVFGPIAQSNHCAANSFMDTLVRYRHSLGLPAQTINWGAWGQIGAAANISKTNLERSYGILFFNPTQGIQALHEILISKRIQTLVVNLNYALLKQIELPPSFRYLDKVLESQTITTAKDNDFSTVNSIEFWNTVKGMSLDERISIIEDYVEKFVRQILKFPESEVVSKVINFSELGMDSLMAVELKNKLQTLLGQNVVLNATALLENPSVKTLGTYLANLTLQVAQADTVALDRKDIHKEIVENDLNLFKADSKLPINIKVIDLASKPSEFRNILLTGATGTLGSYILKELIQSKNNGNGVSRKIYCLVRHKGQSDARGRVLESLQKNGLIESCNDQNLEFIVGDISQKNFGLSLEKYHELTVKIDAVFHYASKINHLELYRKSENCTSDIRSVNVTGLLNILEFACSSRTKHVFCPTSYSAVHNYKGSIDESAMSNLPLMGFALTKLACELLLEQAIQRGIPCTVFRLCSLLGNSVSGKFSFEKNHVATFFISCLRLGVFPSSTQGWHILPVDTAAKVLIRLSENDEIKNIDKTLTICSSEIFTKESIKVVCSELGIDLRFIPDNEFSEIFLQNLDHSGFNLFRDLYSDSKNVIETLHTLAPASISYLGDGEGTNEFHQLVLSDTEIVRNLISDFNEIIPSPIDTVIRHIQYAIKINAFQKYGLQK